jgi:hypothetical protein
MSRVLAVLCLLPSLATAAPLPQPEKPKPGEWKYALKDPNPKLSLQFAENMRFGLALVGVPDPRPEYKDKLKKLTYWETGDSNNTIIKIDANEYFFGRKMLHNRWTGERGAGKEIKLPEGRHGLASEMDFTLERVLVRQDVEIVPGDSGLLDTCLVWYTITNHGDTPQVVGIRVMMDTYIGANDGVPFLIPGRRGFLTTMEEFPQKSIPDYVEAVENPDTPGEPGTVARMRLKGIRLPGVPEIEDIETVRVCRWPQKDVKWSWTMEPMDKDPENRDSCVALYWKQAWMNPGEVRHMAFTYGLSRSEVGGKVDGGASTIALSVPGSVRVDGEFVVTAYLWNTRPGQKVSLINLGDSGLTLAANETAEKPVPSPGKARTQVMWKVKASTRGPWRVEATCGDARAKSAPIKVGAVHLFE